MFASLTIGRSVFTVRCTYFCGMGNKDVFLRRMFRFITLIGLVAAAGCSSKTATTTQDLQELAATHPGCEVEKVEPSYEADGGNYYRGHVEFVFDGEDEDATLTLADGAGTAVEGTTSWEDNKISFAPAAPLTPSTGYAATLTHCGGESTIQFMTTSLGTPLEDGVNLVDKSTWSTWTQHAL